ncbi:MAG: hypothetical protein ACTSQJ_04460 [Promethearchaeota archaeon]
MELTDIETKVLTAIKDYLNKNRIFNAKNILPYLVNCVPDLNENGVEKVLWKFIRERIVVPGSKLTKDNILENSTRKSIYNYINKNPGTFVRELMRKLNLGSHETLWHLNLLIKFGLIRSTKIGKYKAYFDSKLENTFDKEIFYLGNEKINEIIQLLVLNGEGVLISKIAEDLGLHYNTANNYMHKLNDIGLLYSNNVDNQVYYLLNRQRFKEILDGIEEIKKPLR